MGHPVKRRKTIRTPVDGPSRHFTLPQVKRDTAAERAEKDKAIANFFESKR